MPLLIQELPDVDVGKPVSYILEDNRIDFESSLLLKISACIPLIGEFTSRTAQASLVKKYHADGKVSESYKIADLQNTYKVLDLVRACLTGALIIVATSVAGYALFILFGASLTAPSTFASVVTVASSLTIGSALGISIGYMIYTKVKQILENNERFGDPKEQLFSRNQRIFDVANPEDQLR